MKKNLYVMIFTLSILVGSCISEEEQRLFEEEAKVISKKRAAAGKGLINYKISTSHINLDVRGNVGEIFSIGKLTWLFNESNNQIEVAVHLRFKKEYSGDVIINAYDKYGRELGRSFRYVSGKKGDAKYYGFVFESEVPMEDAVYFILSKK